MSEWENVAHEGNRAGQDSVGQGHQDSQDQRTSKGAPPGIEHSVSPGVPCPETVLVAVMTDGSYVLVGYPQSEPAAFLAAEDAGSLRQALQEAFGTAPGTAVSTNGNGRHTSTAPPGHEALCTKQVRR